MTEILTPEQIESYRLHYPPDGNWPVSIGEAAHRLFEVCDSHEALQEELTATLTQLEQVRRSATADHQMTNTYIRDLQKQLAAKQQQGSDANWDKVKEQVDTLHAFLWDAAKGSQQQRAAEIALLDGAHRIVRLLSGGSDHDTED